MYLKKIDDNSDSADVVTFKSTEITEMVLGRGPLMRIIDTKISRNHAKIIYNRDTKSFSFVATTAKPCYFKENVDHDWKYVEADDFVKITEGSIIGLMPHKYIYEIKGMVAEVPTRINLKALKQEAADRPVDREYTQYFDGANFSVRPDSPTAWLDKYRGHINDLMWQQLKRTKRAGHARKTRIRNPDERRPSCRTGERCFRADPAHYDDEAHAGDPDFVALTEEEKRVDAKKLEHFLAHQLVRIDLHGNDDDDEEDEEEEEDENEGISRPVPIMEIFKEEARADWPPAEDVEVNDHSYFEDVNDSDVLNTPIKRSNSPEEEEGEPLEKAMKIC